MKRKSKEAKTPEKTTLVGSYRQNTLEKWVLPVIRSCWTFCLVVLRQRRNAWAKCTLECKEYAT